MAADPLAVSGWLVSLAADQLAFLAADPRAFLPVVPMGEGCREPE
jgi:hypothetical protein